MQKGGEKRRPSASVYLLSTETEEQKKRGRPGNEATQEVQNVLFPLLSTVKVDYRRDCHSCGDTSNHHNHCGSCGHTEPIKPCMFRLSPLTVAALFYRLSHW